MPAGNPAGYMQPPDGPPTAPQGQPPMQGQQQDPAVALIQAGVAKLAPEERQVLVRAITPEVRDVLGKALGPAMHAFLAPFVADDMGGGGPAGPSGAPMRPAGPPAAGPAGQPSRLSMINRAG